MDAYHYTVGRPEIYPQSRLVEISSRVFLSPFILLAGIYINGRIILGKVGDKVSDIRSHVYNKIQGSHKNSSKGLESQL